jgi:hypothetical protein
MRSRSIFAGLLFVILTAACAAGSATSSGAGSNGTTSAASTLDASTFAATVASPDLYAGDPQRVQVGIFNSTQNEGVHLVTSGTIQLSLKPSGGPGTPTTGTATYVPAPGTEGEDGGAPSLTAPDMARGVYQLENVTFDAAGVWEADVNLTVAGSPLSLTTSFSVRKAPLLPAPGERALETDNLTVSSPDVDPSSIDSRATGGEPIPDRDLHQTTIAHAINAHEPALVLFSTPVYCQSQMCGPDTEALQQIARDGPNDAAYIHVEIWKDYQKSIVNQAAADWLLRGGDLTEPWLFLIGRDGKIVDRWGPLFDLNEVRTELEDADAG